MPAIRNLAVLALTVLLVGCSSLSWLPGVGDDEDDKKKAELEPTKLTHIDETVKVKKVWSTGIGDGLGGKYLRVRPAIAADRIFATDGYGRVEALDRFTGKRIWRVELADMEKRSVLHSLNFFDRRDPSFVTGAVGIAHGYVLIGTTRGEVIALSAVDGTEVWRKYVGAEVLAPPVGGDDLVFVETENGRLLALEKADGALRWSFDNPVPVLTLRGTSMPVFGAGMVYAGFADGMVAAIKSGTGEPVWEHRVMLPEGRSELQRMVDIDSTPALAGGVLYVVSYQGKLKALRAADGTVAWEQDVSSFLDVATGSRDVFVVDSSDAVLGYDRQSAEQLWKQEGLLRRQLSSPAAIGDYLVVADDDGYLHVLSQSDGSFVGRRKIDGDGVRSPIVVADDTIYVLGNSGSLQALQIEPR